MVVKNLSWNEHTANKNHSLLPRSLRVWLYAIQAVVRRLCYCIFFFNQVGWIIQNCQFLVRVCFNQSIKFLRKGF